MYKSVLCILLIFSGSSFAQKTAPKSTPKPLSEKEQKYQAQKFAVISLVEKTAEEASFWEDKKSAVEVLADAADLLWPENSGKSEKWLRTAWNLIDEVSDSSNDEKMNDFFTRSDKSDLQTLVLKVAQKHDPKLADKFLKELAEKEPDEKKDGGAFDDKTARSEQLLRLAQEAVETDPNLAFSLAERSLVDGISYSLQYVLTELRKKDANLANRLFDLAFARFANTPSDTSEAQILSGYLFKSGFTFGTNSSGGTILVVNPTQQNLPAVAQSEPLRAKNFLSSVFQKFFSRPVSIETPESRRNAANILILGQQLIGQYRTFAPEFAQPATSFLAQLQALIEPPGQNQNSETKSNFSNLPKNATKEEFYDALIKDLVEKAEKETDPIAKKIAFVRAALSTKAEDYLRGIKIAKEIADDNLREDAISFLLYRAALYFVNKNEIGQAEELAPQIKEVLRRSVVKIAIAKSLLEAIKNKKLEQFQIDLEKQRAFDLLNEVEKDLRKEDVSQNLIKTLFGATSVSAKFDKTQALSLLEQTVQAINQTENFKLSNDSAPRLGLDVAETSGATVENPKIGFGFRSAIELLVETDFEQIASTIERFSAKEVRGFARLEVAKFVLLKNKKTAN